MGSAAQVLSQGLGDLIGLLGDNLIKIGTAAVFGK
jgi:hypothetical protein